MALINFLNHWPVRKAESEIKRHDKNQKYWTYLPFLSVTAGNVVIKQDKKLRKEISGNCVLILEYFMSDCSKMRRNM